MVTFSGNILFENMGVFSGMLPSKITSIRV
nr:MAG TPA: hypothetical protein [Caudoviricetes sp.]DAI33074.1 MAG TPA: hypothetical protein [Caudoviricetes sp.]DAL50327.1 MAG TPA_asm: hypothetical protein [Caudoviricetes sp.]DAW69219.1 MAG TPA: hypothetical protein [Caudoviricetes sp.]